MQADVGVPTHEARISILQKNLSKHHSSVHPVASNLLAVCSWYSAWVRPAVAGGVWSNQACARSVSSHMPHHVGTSMQPHTQILQDGSAVGKLPCSQV